jgi:hypothetical protein
VEFGPSASQRNPLVQCGKGRAFPGQIEVFNFARDDSLLPLIEQLAPFFPTASHRKKSARLGICAISTQKAEDHRAAQFEFAGGSLNSVLRPAIFPEERSQQGLAR